MVLCNHIIALVLCNHCVGVCFFSLQGPFQIHGFALHCNRVASTAPVLCFKDVVERLRPSHALQDVHLVALRNLQLIYDSKGGLYGFVSSHTANLCCIAVIYAKLSSKKKITISCLALWAVLTAYSRVYCGVHYPMDVICGGLLGFVLGEIIYYVFSLLDRKYKWNIEQKE